MWKHRLGDGDEGVGLAFDFALFDEDAETGEAGNGGGDVGDDFAVLIFELAFAFDDFPCESEGLFDEVAGAIAAEGAEAVTVFSSNRGLATGGLLQLFLGDARGGERLVLGANGRARFHHLAGGIDEFPLPVGIRAAAALEAQLDLKRVILGHAGVMPEVCGGGKGKSAFHRATPSWFEGRKGSRFTMRATATSRYK